MAILGTDLLLVGRGSTNYKITGDNLAAFIVPAGLPPQTGNGGKFLTTNGSVLSWATVGGGGGGVTGVTVTAPITDTGTATAPIIGISPATPAAAGSLSGADKTKIDALPATIVSSVTVDGTNGITVNGTAAGVTITTSGTATIDFDISSLTALP